MVNKKITELTELTTPASADVLAIVDDPAGTPETKKVTFGNVESNISHTAISDIGTNTHDEVDTHLADTTNAHAVSSDTLSFTNKTIDDFSNRVDADEVHIKIRNESGSIMTKGKLIYISGYNIGENVPLVTLADASASSTMPMLAMINDADIANNATGHATQSGRVFDIDTSTFSAGDTVYVSTTPGALSTRPSGATDQVQAVGIILRSHASNGVIQIIGAGRINQSPNAGHDAFTDFVGNEHIDWTTDQGATNIHAGNYIDTDTTYVNSDWDHDQLTNFAANEHFTESSITHTNITAGDGSDHADVASNTSARHTQNTDTALGSGAVAADHGTAATDEIINICYGTGSPPTANTTTIGTLFVKYTA